MSVTESELNERIAALEQKKKGLERNRNICVLLAVFLGYNAWKSINEGTPPVWFYFAMSAIIAGVTAVGVFGHFSSVRAGKELRDLLQVREKAQPDSSSYTKE